jgi:transposase-like protein
MASEKGLSKKVRPFDGTVFCPYCSSHRVKTVLGSACCGKFRCKNCGNVYTLSHDETIDTKLLEVPDVKN